LCYPLTVSDAHSRFLLCCKGLDSVGADGAIAGFEETFRAYGLPDAIRTDNGYPFAMATPLGLTQLNVWWTKLGIRHDRIRPGRPEENGSHERMHRTLKAETTRPPGRDLEHQQMKFEDFRAEYDLERPHEALGQRRPADLYVHSDRPMPDQLPEPIYPGHAEVRRVRTNGKIQLRGLEIFISDVLVRESIGLEEIDDGVWSVFFYQRLLGRIDERKLRVSG
jgi:putative transposase